MNRPKIYFAGSIRAGRDDVNLYRELINHLKKYGEVLTEQVGNPKITVSGNESELSDRQIHNRDLEWLHRSEVIVAEVTTPSLGVGYEIGRTAERNQQPPKGEKQAILCLYRPQAGKRLSAMISGFDGVTNIEYSNIEEAKLAIDKFFSSLKRD